MPTASADQQRMGAPVWARARVLFLPWVSGGPLILVGARAAALAAALAASAFLLRAVLALGLTAVTYTSFPRPDDDKGLA